MKLDELYNHINIDGGDTSAIDAPLLVDTGDSNFGLGVSGSTTFFKTRHQCVVRFICRFFFSSLFFLILDAGINVVYLHRILASNNSGINFGSEVLSQITLNLPTNKVSSRVAIYTTLVNPLAKYALMVTPILNALEARILTRPKKGLNILIRTALVLSTIVVALVIPFFEYLMSLVGAFLSVAVSVILPCLCFLKISGIQRGVRLESVSLWGVVLIGVFVLVVGTYTALQKIFQHLMI